MKAKELIEMLKGKEDWEVFLNVKFMGRSVTTDGSIIYVDECSDYGKAFLTTDITQLNRGFDFDDGKGNEWKK